MVKKETGLQESKEYEKKQTQGGITDKVFDIKPENKADDLDYGFGKNKVTASTQLRGIRVRGVNTVQNTLSSIRGTIFNNSLQNGDIWYDYIDRKVKLYATENTDFSFVPQWGLDARAYMAGEYVREGGLLYFAIQDSGLVNQPGTPAGDGFRKLVISYGSILPLDNTNARFFFGLSVFPIPDNVRTQAPVYIGYEANDNYSNLLGGEITIPSTGYYLLNNNETRGPRAGFTSIASRISVFRGGVWIVLSDDYKYNSIITVTGTDSIGGPITTTVNQGTIDISTTKNTWEGYLTKGELIKVEVFHNRTGNIIAIDNDWLQVARLF